ncbi:MAG: TolC family protein [Elusimicrobiota bacterium]|nr:TolC family protein [Elusimicrobiota bacterium]
MLNRLLAATLSLVLAGAPAIAANGGEAPNRASLERVYTLDETLRLMRNDPKLQSAEQGVLIADARVTEARLRFLPDIGLQASATKYHARYPFALSPEFRSLLLFPGAASENIYSGRAYFNMPLYEGRRTMNTLRLAQASQKQALSDRESVRLDVRLRAMEAFYRLLLAQERAAAFSRYLESVEASAGKGDLGPWERVESEATLGAARSRAAEARHALDDARLQFLNTLSLELDTPFRVSGELATRPVRAEVEKAVIWAMELRPELQSQTYRVQMDAIGVNLAIGRRNPTVFLAGDYELTAQRFPLKNNNWDVTLGIKVPFAYDFWSQIKQKRAEQRQGELTRAELQDRVRLEVRQAAETLRWWQEEWPRRESQWKKIQSLYDEAAGKPGAALSRLRALNGVLELQLSHLAAVTEHILARARFERAVGRELPQ